MMNRDNNISSKVIWFWEYLSICMRLFAILLYCILNEKTGFKSVWYIGFFLFCMLLLKDTSAKSKWKKIKHCKYQKRGKMSYISTFNQSLSKLKSLKCGTFSTHSSFPIPQVSLVLIFFIFSSSVIQILMGNNQDHALCFKSNCNSTLKSMIYWHLLCN